MSVSEQASSKEENQRSISEFRDTSTRITLLAGSVSLDASFSNRLLRPEAREVLEDWYRDWQPVIHLALQETVLGIGGVMASLTNQTVPEETTLALHFCYEAAQDALVAAGE